MKQTVVMLLYDDVEVLDFAGPFEVFTIANEHRGYALFDFTTVAKDSGPIRAHNGLSVIPERSTRDVPEADVLIVPGGDDISHVLNDPDLLRWVAKVSEGASTVLSVCSGSLILAKAGVLDGLRATTHRVDLDELTDLAPNTEIVRGVTYVDNGKVVTSAGITAGIDASLHVIEKLYGRELAERTVRSLEYSRRRA